MKEIITKQKNELIIGLADLYVQKEQIEEQIKAQKVAIEQCSIFSKQADELKGD